MRSAMIEPSDLTRSMQEFADTLCGLRPEKLTKEERATMRGVLVELNWLIEQSEPEGTLST